MTNGIPKDGYRVLERLIREEWHTEGSAVTDGSLTFDGFYGTYEIVVQTGEGSHTFDASLNRNDPRKISLFI